MDIYSTHWTKVIYSNSKSGYESDQEIAKKHLKVDSEYTIDKTVVWSSHTLVYLKEFPWIEFNSVIFSDWKNTILQKLKNLINKIIK